MRGPGQRRAEMPPQAERQRAAASGRSALPDEGIERRSRGWSTLDLPLIWTGIIGFAVFMYVLMDGFDLGVGILFPFAPSDTGARHR